MLVPNLEHKIHTPNVTVGNEAKTARPLRALILEDDDVVDVPVLRKVLPELRQL